MASLFERNFKKLLEEDEELCRSSFRRDKLGNRVEIPYGGTYKVGKNGRGVGVPKGWQAKEDNVGQMHVIPPGKVLKTGANGKGVVVCPGEVTSEKKGQIVSRKKLRTEWTQLECLKLLWLAKLGTKGETP